LNKVVIFITNTGTVTYLHFNLVQTLDLYWQMKIFH